MTPFSHIVRPVVFALIALLMPLRAGADPAEELQERLERLRSVPYTSTTTEPVDTDDSGVGIYKQDLVCEGYNLYCPALGSDVMLMDMEGSVVHRWSCPDSEHGQWQHAIMLPNGDAVAISNEPNYLMRLDWQSNVVWKRAIACHHDVVLSPDSTLYVIIDEKFPYRGMLVRFPAVLELTLDGEEIDRWTACEYLDDIKDAFETRSFLDTILDGMLAEMSEDQALEKISRGWKASRLLDGSTVYDYFHMNTISVLPETPVSQVDRRFGGGNWLICFKHVNQIAVLDRDTKEILWVWGEGKLEWPHHPTMLENGNILIFDNGSKRKFSKVIELDPLSRTVEWEYVGDPPEKFYSHSRGSAQRLPNGNTLMCEGDKGRAFEVTKDGEIVWEWVNPETVKGRRTQVYRMMRLLPEEVDPSW